MTTFAAFRRQTDLELQDRLCTSEIVSLYHATRAQIVRLEAGGQLAGIERRGRVWFARAAVDRLFKHRG